MRFIIIGAGGIGCYYGAKLQQASVWKQRVNTGNQNLRAGACKLMVINHNFFCYGYQNLLQTNVTQSAN